MFAFFQVFRLRVLLVAGLIAVTSLSAVSASPASQSPKTSPAQRAQLVENYGKLPLSFEANQGQSDAQVKFLAHGQGYGVYLTGQEAVLSLSKSEGKTKARDPKAAAGSHRQATQDQPEKLLQDVVRLKLTGASADARPAGEEPLPGKVNYLIGNDPAKWHASVPTYAKVRYSGIYPGVDLVYYGNQRQLEYDFVVAPGADPKPIRLRFGGAKGLRIAANGDLEIAAAGGMLAFHKPTVYQMADGQRKAVAGSFALLSKHTVGFRLGSYDRDQPLVIDPMLVYSTYLGGGLGNNGGDDSASAITIDAAGYAYVTGSAGSTDFPVTTGAYQTADACSVPAFVTKLNQAGTALVYSALLGGRGDTTADCGGNINANALAVDSSGNAYISGQVFSPNFPVTAGAFQSTNKAYNNGGNSNAFITKLSPNGNVLVYSTYLGGSGNGEGGDYAMGLAVDSSGNAYVAGYATSTDFPVTSGAFQTTNHASAVVNQYNTNAFVTKLNPAGTALVYSTYLGGSLYSSDSDGGDGANGLTVDGSGNAYIAGVTYSADFPVTPEAYQTTNHAASDDYDAGSSFVTKLNPAGTELVYSTYLGNAAGSVTPKGVAVDSSGSAYIAGWVGTIGFPVTAGAFQATNKSTSGTNAFVTKLNQAGSGLVYSTYLGGSVNDAANGIAVDGSGYAYITGQAFSPDFPVTSGAYQTTNKAYAIEASNAFFTKLNPAGSALAYSTYLGGSGNSNDSGGDGASGITLDSSGNAYITGGTESVDFPVTSGAYQITNKAYTYFSGSNAFITKLDLNTTTQTATTTTLTPVPTPNPSIYGDSVTLSATVSGDSGSIPNEEQVTFLSGTTTLGTGTLSGGVASLTTTVLPTGTDSMTAVYGGDDNFASSTSTAISQVVNKASSTTALNSSLNPSTFGQSVNITATVSGQFGGTATGLVTFNNGSTSLGSISLSGGTAVLTTTALPVGTDSITAVYGGDMNFTGSTSTVLSQVVNATAVAPTITWATPAAITYGTALSATQLNATSTVGGTFSYNPLAGTVLGVGSRTLSVTFTPTNTNDYTTATATVQLTVNKASSLVPTWPTASSITYGQTLASSTLSGGASTPAGSFAFATPTTVPNAGTASQSITFTPTDATDYTTASGSVQLAVNKATPTITWPTPANITVGTALSSTQLDATFSWTVGGSTVTVPGNPVYSPASGTVESTAGAQTLSVTFTPTDTTDYTTTTASVSLNVTSITVSGTAVTVAPGATTGNTSTITVTPVSSFTGTVSLSCAISPTAASKPATCSLSPASVAISGAAQTSTLTVSTTAATTCSSALVHPKLPGESWYAAGGATLACLLLFGIPARRRSWRTMLGMLALLAALSGGVLACGGGGGGGGNNCTPNSGTTAGTYTITVTGTSGTIVSTGTVTLTVQ